MIDFKLIEPGILNDTSYYKIIEENIYKEIADVRGYADHRIAISMKLEEGEDSQYPLEDILDKYLLHVEESLDSDDDRIVKCILGGDLEAIKKFKSIIGKRAYNEEYVDEDGGKRIRLIIE